MFRDWLDRTDRSPAEATRETLFIAGRPDALTTSANGVQMAVPFRAHEGYPLLKPVASETNPSYPVSGTAIGDDIVRISFGEKIADSNSPLFEWDPALVAVPLATLRSADGWSAIDPHGRARLRVKTSDPPTRKWRSSNLDEPLAAFTVTVSPDGNVDVPFSAWDSFFPGEFNSFPLAYLMRDGRRERVMFSLQAKHDECFAGTGERFSKMDLSGRTIDLRNLDAMGVNNRRAYKNIPFYISSRGYGLLILTPAHVKLSLSDLSTRAAMGMVEHDTLDLFFIGGGSIERILHNLRRITGFPPEVPVWSYGAWMGRMSYLNAADVEQVATRLREGRFPCDVIHIDTGWFSEDWACDWRFCPQKFPNPGTFLSTLRERGYRVSLWQLPTVSAKTRLFDEAAANGFLPARTEADNAAGGSNLGSQRFGGSIDLTNPRACEWYRGLLANLLTTGVSAIKADFGEEIDMDGRYHAAPPELLHNVYALLYQQLVYETTAQTLGRDQAIIWARSGWIGSQRYPVHWAGDAACTWDGLAGSIRGGLHLGLSGFAFWSHDVPGFHGVPDFMSNWPGEELYVRWLQAAIFGSHLRFHGAQPREPYEYPRIAPIARHWLNLRYALIPYLVDQGRRSCQSGFPVLRALILHHQHDRTCWHIDDQFFCGDHLLVAPVLNPEGTRDVYLPAGKWVDVWTGEQMVGPKWIRTASPLTRIPVFAEAGSAVPIYPHAVACTDQMDWQAVVMLRFDDEYQGISRSHLLGRESSWQLDL